VFVPIARFVPTARFAHGDLVQMLEVLDEIASASRVRCPAPVTAGVTEVGRWLRQLVAGQAANLVRVPTEVSLLARCRAADVLGNGLGSDVVVGVPTAEVLDAAARLLDASELLYRHGLPIEAFALEGIEGRLVEAALGAGRIEEAFGQPAC
jgi:hypothetical protein